MANLTRIYPDTLMRFRMSSFALVAVLAAAAICSRFLRKQIPLRILLFFLAYLAAILFSMVHSENMPYIKEYFGEGYTIKFVLLFSLLFVYEENPDTRIRQLAVIAVVALLSYQLGLSKDIYREETGNFMYMDLGYGCAPWWVMVAQGIFYFKKWWAKAACLIAAAYFAAVIAIYGNRSALVLIAAAMGVLLLVYVPLKHLVFLGTVFAAALLGLFAFLQPVLVFLSEKMGFDLSRSRNFRILTSDLNLLTYDSGRLPLIRESMAGILEHPLLGMGIGGDRVLISSHTYPHNVVMELGVQFGVIIAALIYVWLLYIGIRALFYWRDRDWKALFLPFYVFSMIRTFFGEPIHESGYLMASIMIYLTYTTYISPAQDKRRQPGGPGAERWYDSPPDCPGRIEIE